MKFLWIPVLMSPKRFSRTYSSLISAEFSRWKLSLHSICGSSKPTAFLSGSPYVNEGICKYQSSAIRFKTYRQSLHKHSTLIITLSAYRVIKGVLDVLVAFSLISRAPSVQEVWNPRDYISTQYSRFGFNVQVVFDHAYRLVRLV